MQPINDYIAVQKTDGEAEKTDSGIYIAKTEHDEPEYHQGIVKKVCETKNSDGGKVSVGDRIVYKHYRNIKYKGYEMIKFEDIILIDNNE